MVARAALDQPQRRRGAAGRTASAREASSPRAADLGKQPDGGEGGEHRNERKRPGQVGVTLRGERRVGPGTEAHAVLELVHDERPGAEERAPAKHRTALLHGPSMTAATARADRLAAGPL